MIKVFLFDLSRTILFPKDKSYKGELNALHKKLSLKPNYNFSDHFELDEGLLTYLHSIRNERDLYIFTSGSIQNAPEIKPRLNEIFKKIYSSEDIGISKKDPRSYEFIAKDIGVTPDEILFMDDSKENIKIAREVGFVTALYREFDELRKKLRKVLSQR